MTLLFNCFLIVKNIFKNIEKTIDKFLSSCYFIYYQVPRDSKVSQVWLEGRNRRKKEALALIEKPGLSKKTKQLKGTGAERQQEE